jgi:hypothetical protein
MLCTIDTSFRRRINEGRRGPRWALLNRIKLFLCEAESLGDMPAATMTGLYLWAMQQKDTRKLQQSTATGRVVLFHHNRQSRRNEKRR